MTSKKVHHCWDCCVECYTATSDADKEQEDARCGTTIGELAYLDLCSVSLEHFSRLLERTTKILDERDRVLEEQEKEEPEKKRHDEVPPASTLAGTWIRPRHKKITQ